MKKFIAVCFALLTLFAFSFRVAKADVSPQKHESGIVYDVGLAKADLSQSFTEVISPFVFDLYGNEVLYSSPVTFMKTQATNLKSSVWKPDNWQHLRYAYCSRNADIDLPNNYQHKPYFRHYKNYGNRKVHRCTFR